MAFFGFLIALMFFCHYKRRLRHYRGQYRLEDEPRPESPGTASWNDQWHRHWADKFDRQAQRRLRQIERDVQRKVQKLDRQARRFGFSVVGGAAAKTQPETPEPARDVRSHAP